jgi:enoyl-CoA hydratase/carnithine racemase
LRRVTSRFVEIEEDGGVTIVRLNRPPVNAIDPEFAADGLAVLEELRSGAGGAVVITGSGSAFCAGLDIKVAPTLDDEAQRSMRESINGLLGGWALFPRPLVTAVNGHAIAGGLILALCGDFRVAGPHGQFGLTEVKVGVPYPPAAMAIVRSELSPPIARRYALGNEVVGSDAALRDGMFDKLVAADEVLPTAIAAARELAPLAGPAYTHTKRALRSGVVRALDPGAIADESWLADDAAERARETLG